jgi:hypothetical protein
MGIIHKIQRKGQIDIQFNWVFILLIGVIILSFFVGIAIWYKNTQEQKISGLIVLELESLLKAAKESPKTARETTLPDITLTFTCSPDDCSDYGCASDFSGGGISRSTETEILFAPLTLSGTTLITWALEWQLPYKIANFLYVTADSVRYVIVYDEDHQETAIAVTSLLAENSYITKETVRVEQPSDFSITDKNDAYVRIVAFLDKGSLSETAIDSALDEKEWDLIYIDGSEDSGTITFNDGDAVYVGLPALLGAVFSSDLAFYQCNIKKAGLQATVVGEVYAARTAALYDSFLADSEKSYCQYYYDESVQNNITSIADELVAEELTVATISTAVSTLEDNNAYAVIKGCPRVY